MTQQLARILKDQLDELNIIDRKAGLVIVGEKAQPTDVNGAFAVSKFPISVDAKYDDCMNNSCYQDLVPNSNAKGIFYFEDFGTIPKGIERGYFKYASKLRLIVWLNHDLIQSEGCKNINHLAITKIRSLLEGKGYFNAGEFSKIKVSPTNIIENDYQLFSKYTYPHEIYKYLMHPYSAFGIDFLIEYSVSQSCLSQITINPKEC